MTRKSHPPRDRSPRLTEEDEELWRHTARTLVPLKRRKGHVSDKAIATLEAESLSKRPTSARGSDADPGARQQPRPRTTPAPDPARPVASRTIPPSPTGFDPKHLRKLRRGGIEIEARIDLHGMRQAQAHASLYKFLRRAHASGKRWVLVITGKGSARGSSGEGVSWETTTPERGVLKRNVPLWLGEPELRSLIVSFTEAAAEHGGSGALYVHLRRSDRMR